MNVKYNLTDIRYVIVITTRKSTDLDLQYLIEDLFPPGEFSQITHSDLSLVLSTDYLQTTRKRYHHTDIRSRKSSFITTLCVLNSLDHNQLNHPFYTDIMVYIGNIMVILWNPLKTRLPFGRNQCKDQTVIIFDNNLPKKNGQWEIIKTLYSYSNEFGKDPRKAYTKYIQSGKWLVTLFPDNPFDYRYRGNGITKRTICTSFIPLQQTRDQEIIKAVDVVKELLTPRLGRDVIGVILGYVEEFRREWPLPKKYTKVFEITGTRPEIKKDTRYIKQLEK